MLPSPPLPDLLSSALNPDNAQGTSHEADPHFYISILSRHRVRADSVGAGAGGSAIRDREPLRARGLHPAAGQDGQIRGAPHASCADADRGDTLVVSGSARPSLWRDRSAFSRLRRKSLTAALRPGADLCSASDAHSGGAGLSARHLAAKSELAIRALGGKLGFVVSRYAEGPVSNAACLDYSAVAAVRADSQKPPALVVLYVAHRHAANGAGDLSDPDGD